MTTRSIVARPDGDAWQGTYVQCDGMPASAGNALLAQVRHRGVAEARDIYAAGVRWRSWLSIAEPDHLEEPRWLFDGLVWEPGVGVGLPRHPEHLSEDWVYTPHNLRDPFWLEWTYILGDGALFVLKGPGQKPFAEIRYDTDFTFPQEAA